MDSGVSGSDSNASEDSGADDTGTPLVATAPCDNTLLGVRAEKLCGMLEDVIIGRQTSSVFAGDGSSATSSGTDQPILAAVSGPNTDEELGAWVALGLSASDLSGMDKASAVLSAEPIEDIDGVGTAVDASVDLDGDGYNELVLGTPFVSIRLFSEGRVLVYNGPVTTDRDLHDPDVHVDGEYDGQYFGYCLTGVPDTNDDGYDDLLVGTYLGSSPGQPTAFFRGPVEDQRSSDGYAVYWRDGYYIGTSTDQADLNGDGIAELILGGVVGDDASLTGLYLLDPNLGGDVNLADVSVIYESGDIDIYPWDVDAGDNTGDGYADLLVLSTVRPNALYLLPGPFSTDVSTPAEGAVASIDVEPIDNGLSVGKFTGDLNGDGLSADLLVSSSEGDLYMLPAPLEGSYTQDSTPPLTRDTVNPVWFSSFSPLGDLDGDGYDDALLGAPGDDTYAEDAGALFTLYGDAW